MRDSPRNGDAIEMLLKARTSTQTTARLVYVLYFIMQDDLQVFCPRFQEVSEACPGKVGWRYRTVSYRIYLVADKFGTWRASRRAVQLLKNYLTHRISRETSSS